MRVLIADDERDMVRALTVLLQHSGYETDTVYDGKQALEKGLCETYDCLILDIMMPELDGLSVLSRLRSAHVLTPVLLLTARSEVDDRIAGLDSGADDYLTKPFDTGEFLARVRALVRRGRELSPGLSAGNISLDCSTQSLSCGFSTIRLSTQESKMLELLIRQMGRPVSERQLVEFAWGLTEGDESDIIWTYISYLKKKLAAIGADITVSYLDDGHYILTEAAE